MEAGWWLRWPTLWDPSLQVDEIETILLPDRNVASRMAQIAKGMAIGKAQLIAGINAFAHFFDILTEPSIAFHELGRREGYEAALQELAWFRAADHDNKFDWLEVALRRAERLARPEEARALESHDLAAGLRDWSTSYGAVLKLAQIPVGANTQAS